MVHSVELCSDVYQVCLTHALSTEKEEVMGLLMGEVDLSACLNSLYTVKVCYSVACSTVAP